MPVAGSQAARHDFGSIGLPAMRCASSVTRTTRCAPAKAASVGGAVAVLVVHRQVAGHVGMQLRRPRRQRVGGVDHRRQVAIAHDDPLGGILRRGLAVGDDQRHRLADEPHPPMGERVAMRDLERGPVLALEMRQRTGVLDAGAHQVVAGEHGAHARARQGLTRIERGDFGMGAIGAQEPAMQLSRQAPVGGETPASGDQTKVLAPAFERVAHRCLRSGIGYVDGRDLASRPWRRECPALRGLRQQRNGAYLCVRSSTTSDDTRGVPLRGRAGSPPCGRASRPARDSPRSPSSSTAKAPRGSSSKP